MEKKTGISVKTRKYDSIESSPGVIVRKIVMDRQTGRCLNLPTLRGTERRQIGQVSQTTDGETF